MVVAGATMLALAGVLVYVAFRNRVNRAFALYLVLRGMVNLLGGLGLAGLAPIAERLAPYYQIGSTFALVWFVIVFYERRVLGRVGASSAAVRASGGRCS